jgi:hypothetical protein
MQGTRQGLPKSKLRHEPKYSSGGWRQQPIPIMSFIKDTKVQGLITIRFKEGWLTTDMEPDTRGVLIALIFVIFTFAAGMASYVLR